MIAAAPLPASARSLPVSRRTDIVAEPLVVRGKKWWRLKDPIRLQYWQLGDEEYFLWSQLNGGVSVDGLLEQFSSRFSPRRMERAQLHHFLATLHREGLAYSTERGQADILLERNQQRRVRNWWNGLSNVLAIRFRGVDPSGFIEWLNTRLAWIFSPFVLLLCVLLVTSAGLLAVTEAGQLADRLRHSTEFLTVGNLPWLALTLAAMKICHEFGHALTFRRFGGRCHELGLMLLVFTPCLYCNVSDAWLLPSRWHRLAISAAGMAVEIVLAAFATWAWWFSEPGLFATLCLNVMVIGTGNTLLFNGNPLLRFDGYFLLSDWLEIPNLRPASDAWLHARIARWFGMDPPVRTLPGTDRPVVLASYAILSTIYRTGLTLLIWWVVYQWLASIGLAIVGAGVLVGSAATMIEGHRRTSWPGISRALHHQSLRRGRLGMSAVALAVVLAGAVLIPLPARVTSVAMVQAVDAATVFVTFPGTLIEAIAAGTRVERGDVLARLKNDELHRNLLELTAERDVLQRRLEVLTRRRVVETDTGIPSAAGQAELVARQLSDVEDRLTQKLADHAKLEIRSPRAGIVLPWTEPRSASPTTELPGWDDVLLAPCNVGCFLESGEILCQIGEPEQGEALVYVEQAQIGKIHTGQWVIVQLGALPGANRQGTVKHVSATPVQSPAAELVATGKLPVAVDSAELRLVETYYPVVVRLDAGPLVPVGATGRVRIQVAAATLVERTYAAICGLVRW